MRKRGFLLAAAAVLAVGVLVGPGLAGAAQPLTPDHPAAAAAGGGNDTPTAWFVELKSPPAVKGTSAAALKSEHDAFKANAAAAGVNYTERYSFSTLWNGFSLRVPLSQVGPLSTVPGVKAIYPVQPVSIGPEPISQGNPDDANSNPMIQADVAQDDLGFDGTGVKIAIMDSGVDYTLPELGGCFGPGCKVAKGFDLVGDSFDSNPADSTYQPIPHPDPDPAPCDPNVADARANGPGTGPRTSNGGHGTHVAGIAAADGRGHPGEVTGVAPGATIYAYRVFGCNGSTDDDTMIAAMEMVKRDGANVLNMSIGSAFDTWSESPTAQAASNLADSGVVVVASIGNSGASGLYSGGAPGVGTNVIGVASVDNTKATGTGLRINGNLFGYVVAAGAPEPPRSGAFTILSAPVANKTGCNAFAPGFFSGKIALIQRGGCTFYVKASNAMAAGAAGVVLFNNVAAPVAPTVVGDPPITIPVVLVSKADGDSVYTAALAGVPFEWTNENVELPIATAGLISDFSSYGTDAELNLKPDLSAPGGQIFSTWPHQQFGGHNSISGTSMAAPHVAGAAALYLQAHPGASPAAVQTAFMNTAKPGNWSGRPALGFLDLTYRQGAGLLQVANAISATTSATPTKISLGEGTGGTRTLSIRNDASTPVTYNLSDIDVVSTDPGTFAPLGFEIGANSVTFSPAQVTVPAGGSANVTVTIAADPTLPNDGLYDGYLTLTPVGGGQVLSVPWVGFKGDYQSIQILTEANCGLPALFQVKSGANDACLGSGLQRIGGGGATYTLQGSDVPILLYHFNHQVRTMTIQVENADGSFVHPVFNFADKEQYLPSNSGPVVTPTATPVFEFDWDGTRGQDNGNNKRKVVPNGTYKLKLSVLKPLGDANNPADWETFTTPPITLARP
jgi:subtilisin family serine protease